MCGTPEYLAPEIIINKGYNHAVCILFIVYTNLFNVHTWPSFTSCNLICFIWVVYLYYMRTFCSALWYLKVDWWAIGVLTFEMRCGHSPFEAQSQMEMFEKITKGDFKFPRDFTEEEIELIAGLLQVYIWHPKKKASARVIFSFIYKKRKLVFAI